MASPTMTDCQLAYFMDEGHLPESDDVLATVMGGTFVHRGPLAPDTRKRLRKAKKQAPQMHCFPSILGCHDLANEREENEGTSPFIPAEDICADEDSPVPFYDLAEEAEEELGCSLEDAFTALFYLGGVPMLAKAYDRLQRLAEQEGHDRTARKFEEGFLFSLHHLVRRGAIRKRNLAAVVNGGGMTFLQCLQYDMRHGDEVAEVILGMFNDAARPAH